MRFLPLAWCVLAGCGGLYHSSAIHAPLFTSGGQLHVAGHVGTGGYEGQIAVAPIPHFAVIGSVSHLVANDARQTYGELGFGTMFRLRELEVNARQVAMLEIFGGVGVGRSSGLSYVWIIEGPDDDSDDGRGRFVKPFVQVDLGGTIGLGGIASGLSARISYLQYHYAELPSGRTDEHPAALLFEPGVFIRVGSEALVFDMQLGFVFSTGSDAAPGTFPLMASVGIRARFDFDGDDDE